MARRIHLVTRSRFDSWPQQTVSLSPLHLRSNATTLAAFPRSDEHTHISQVYFSPRTLAATLEYQERSFGGIWTEHMHTTKLQGNLVSQQIFRVCRSAGAAWENNHLRAGCVHTCNRMVHCWSPLPWIGRQGMVDAVHSHTSETFCTWASSVGIALCNAI